MNADTIDWGLAAAVAFGVLLAVLTAVLADTAGLSGPAAVAAPLLVGVVVAAGIRLGYA
ncbi:hypothetical protein [Halobacterium bonnevillei]|uniref:Uncharacterized protein n=1 Tax=Halobacterium bonnevillei TaxID=2692200 RepID=A0A6B0SKY9_9EURY|nr:hypothetical protein [Halobacterium bonnevillei]MXR22474.1 hypothetical protein [Halobacterium bonnevillei]